METSVICLVLTSILFAQTMVVLTKSCDNFSMTTVLTHLVKDTRNNIQNDATLAVTSVTTVGDEQAMCMVMLQLWLYAEALQKYSRKFGEGMLKKNLTKIVENTQKNMYQTNIRQVRSHLQNKEAEANKTNMNIKELFSHMKQLWNLTKFHGLDCSCRNFSLNRKHQINTTTSQSNVSEDNVTTLLNCPWTKSEISSKEWLTQVPTFLMGMVTSTLLIGIVYLFKNKFHKHKRNYMMNTNRVVEENEEEDIPGSVLLESAAV